MQNKKGPQRLVSEVQLFRIRVATVESRVKVLREHARQAKRRRKEAKRLAQHARKEFKRSKVELAELREALAFAETKLFQAGGRALARKMAKPKPAARSMAETPKQLKPAAHSPPPAPTAVIRSPRRRTPKPLPAKKTETASQGHAGTTVVEPSHVTIQVLDTNSKTYEQEHRDRRQPEVEHEKV